MKVLEVDLFSAAWEIRHGAAIALRELLKVQGQCGGMQGELRMLGVIIVPLHTHPPQMGLPSKKMRSAMKDGAIILRQNFFASSSSTALATSFLIRFAKLVLNPIVA